MQQDVFWRNLANSGLARHFLQCLGEKICFIGNDLFVELYVTQAGAIYSGYDESLCCLGVTPIEAINRLCADAFAGLEIHDVTRDLPPQP